MNENILIVPATGEQSNQFVGIKIANNKIEFHYPETYDLSEIDNVNELRKDILSILGTISLAKTRTNTLSTYNTQYTSDETFPIESYLWIINDYLSYGRYENREKVYVDGIQGRVNWKKTFKQNPIISRGNIIYVNIISEKKNQKENIITEIYNCCVKLSIENIGWIYGLSFDSEGVDYDFLIKNNHDYYITVLNNELTKTFDDNKKIRLQNMKNVLTGLDDNTVNTREMTYGVDSYDYVFERLVDCVFSSEEDIRKFYPYAKVHLRIDQRTVDSTNLRPDTIIVDEDNNNVYIIDAKNYRYGTTFNSNDIPETTSIQKQVTYGEFIKKMKDEYNEVYSAFVMPYSKTRNKNNKILNKDIEYVATSETSWYDDDGSKNRKIINLLVDMTFLIQNWNDKRNKKRNIELLIDSIERYL